MLYLQRLVIKAPANRNTQPLCASLKMTTVNKNRTIELSVTGLTIIILVLTILTYKLDQQKSNWVCGPVLLLMEIVALGIQTFLTVSIWKTTNQKTKITLLALSLLIIGFVTYGFVNFNLKCT